MFDFSAGELLLVAIIAIVVIGPKDMPLALRTAGRWIGKVRRVSNHFRTGLDAMIREAELEEMEKKWQEQNRKVIEANPEAKLDGTNAQGEDFVPPPAEPENLLPPPASAEARADEPAKDPEKTGSGA